MNSFVTRRRIAAAAIVSALALSGCAAAPGSSDSGGLAVVATTTQVGDFVAQVGGDDIRLTTLLAPGSSAHHFDPSPKQLLELGRADILVESGAGLEGFVQSAIEASGFAGTTITAADGIDLEQAREITAESEEPGSEHDHDHDQDEGHDQDQAQDDDHDHDHGTLNPHLWTSPRFAEGMVREIAEGLADADPAHAAGYRERADAYVAKLKSLDTWVAAQFARVPAAQRLFVSGHDAMSYYLHDYGIRSIGSLLPGFEDNAEPSAAQIDALIAAIKRYKVKAIFTESSISPKLAETVAKQTGAAWISGEGSLYVDALGAPGSGADTYLGATEHNTRVILEAWGVHPDPLPADLLPR